MVPSISEVSIYPWSNHIKNTKNDEQNMTSESFENTNNNKQALSH